MLVSLEDLKDYNSITINDDDHMLYEALQAGWKELEDMLDYMLESAAYTEYYRGNGDSTLMVNTYPVTVVTDIWDDTDFVFGDDTKIDSDDILLKLPDSSMGIITFIDTVLTESPKRPNVKITYTAGYVATTFPRDLKNAALMLASAAYRDAKGGVNSVTGKQEDIVENWKKRARGIANRYRRIV